MKQTAKEVCVGAINNGLTLVQGNYCWVLQDGLPQQHTNQHAQKRALAGPLSSYFFATSAEAGCLGFIKLKSISDRFAV